MCVCMYTVYELYILAEIVLCMTCNKTKANHSIKEHRAISPLLWGRSVLRREKKNPDVDFKAVFFLSA